MEFEIPKQQAAVPAAPKVPAPVSARELEARYVEQINAMVDDATGRRMLQVFVDVAAWKLASIAYDSGPAAAGDVIRRLGFHLQQFALRDHAERQAEAAKAQGRLPQ